MTPTLYQTLLGAAFFRLPDGLRALHGVHGTARYAGEVTVVRGTGLLARLCARLAGMPRAMTGAPITVDFASGPKGEVWSRVFGTPPKASRLRSRLSQRDGQLRERIGPVHFRFVLHTWDGTIFWNVAGARLLGVLPLPAALVCFSPVTDLSGATWHQPPGAQPKSTTRAPGTRNRYLSSSSRIL